MTTDGHRVRVHLDELLAERGLTLTELADRVGITLANLSVLKNGRARAVRFTTLTALCDVLDCQPGDILRVDAAPGAPATSREPTAAHDPAAADHGTAAADHEPAKAGSTP